MLTRLGSIGFALAALGAAAGCNQAAAAQAAATAEADVKKPVASATPQAADSPAGRAGSSRYAVPFAWESSPAEPLSVARVFLGDALRDNRLHAGQGAKVFHEYREQQTPRATVVTCSDSRVHTSAFDSTPENDVFMVRNIGNQIGHAEGSVEYGVEQLATPVLMVIGHTGCGAVKAALGDLTKQSKAVRGELAHMKLPKPEAAKDEKTAWSDGVVANVHLQVAGAVRTYGERVQQGKLTIVGAVYDFRNDLGNGAGKLTIVDVNGNDEAERMKAFVQALGAPSMAAGRASAAAAAPRASAHAWSPHDLARALAELEARQSPAKARHR
jgi:carbonic anhydrase